MTLHTELMTQTEHAAALLRAGRLVAFATETVYGLGANALDPMAVAKIFKAKQRPQFDPLIVHLADPDEVERYAASVSKTARVLSEHFWPGPLTLVLPKRSVIPDLVTSGLPNVALRVPANDQARTLIRAAGVPVAAPSANVFGSVSPTTAQHVLDGLGGRIDAVLLGEACRIGVESTVIACPAEGTPTLLRPGGLTVEEIENVIGPILRLQHSHSSDDTPQPGPGLLSRHYAPAKPIHIFANVRELPHDNRVGVLAFGPYEDDRFTIVENLSPTASLTEAAANFFAALRRLEVAEIELIAAQWLPNEGLGLALNDRLRRAAQQT